MKDRKEIDSLIRELWSAFKKATDKQEVLDKLTDADMELWEEITKHPAIQDRLDSTIPK